MKRLFVAFPLLILLPVQIMLLSCGPGTESAAKVIDSSIDSLLEGYKSIKTDSTINISRKLVLNKELFKKAENISDSLALELLAQRCSLYVYQKQPDSALYTAQIMLEKASTLGDSTFMARAHFRLGYYNREANQFGASLDHYYKSKELYIALNDSTNAGRKLLNLANLLNALGNYNEGERTAVEGLSFLENSELHRYIAGLYNALAISAMGQKNFQDAIHWYERALNISPRPITRVNLRNNIARAYIELEDYKTAQNSLSQLLHDSLLRDEQYIRVRARVIDNLGHVKTRLQLPGAETDLLEALELRISANYLPGQYVSYLHLEEYYHNRSPDQALQMAKMAYDLSLKLENPDDILGALAVLIDLEENPKKYAQSYKKINDSITEFRLNAKNQFAKVRFESEKNRQLAMEAARDAELKSLELEKSKARNLLMAGTILLILLTAYFAYRMLRARHLKKELQSSYRAEARISKQVHDELANDIFNIMTYTESTELKNKDEKENLISHLDQVYLKSRNISRSNAAIDTGEHFPEALKELLSAYSTQNVNVLVKGIDSIEWLNMDPLKKITTYRVLQELMVNMKKHSKASVVLLEFQNDQNQLDISYSDNGIGIPEGTQLDKGGLSNVENRIEAVGGRFSFESKAGKGFKSEISIPV